MASRDTLLIYENENTVTNSVERVLGGKGYGFIRVDAPDTVLPLLESKDRIRAVLFVNDKSNRAESLVALKLLKQIARDIPLIYAADENDSDSETEVRHIGLFYYHAFNAARGNLNELVEVIEHAIKKSVLNDRFLTSL